MTGGEVQQRVDTPTMGEPRSSWSTRGACSVDSTPFMVEPINLPKCKEICRLCPVVDLCLAYAIANDEKYGVWGGMNRKERKAHKSKTDVSQVPLEFRDHYLKVEGRVKRNNPTPRYSRNPDLDLVIDPEFIEYLNSLGA